LSGRLTEIQARRERLIVRAAAERAAVSRAVRELSPPIRLIDRGLAIVSFFKLHPALLAAAMVILALLRPRASFRWARRALLLWRSYRWLFQKAAV
jgi:hypothetical protein